MVCHKLKLKLVLDSRSEGFDAVGKNDLQVQIKTRRSESEGLPSNAGRTGRFSKHKFHYALLALLDNKYKLCEIWQADYKKLNPIIEKQKHRAPNLSAFKDAGKPIFKYNTFDDMRKKLKPA